MTFIKCLVVSSAIALLTLLPSAGNATIAKVKPPSHKEVPMIPRLTQIKAQPKAELSYIPTPPPPVTPSPPQPAPSDRAAVMTAAGISASDQPYAAYIFNHESGFCATKWEGEIGYCPPKSSELFDWSYPLKGYGVCQSTPAIKMSATGSDWQTNIVTQIKWCSTHAQQYGGWQGSYNYWVEHHNW